MNQGITRGEMPVTRAGAVRKPRALARGDTVGIIAPSGSMADPGRLPLAVAAVEKLGFKVKLAEGCSFSYGYLAGSDEIRARDLNAFFADPEVDGIFCLKGGYGTPRILDLIDWNCAARNPKVFVGYSDITAIHQGLWKFASLATFHGPMPSSDMIPEFDSFSEESLLRAVTSSQALEAMVPPPGRLPECLVPGIVQGPVVGGNLSLVAATMGTPWELDVQDSILVLEDVDESPYRIDRMLTQLRLAGVLSRCRGLLLGDWKRCEAPEGKKSLSLKEVFSDILGRDRPVLANVAVGHCSPVHTLPLGVVARLDAEAGTLVYLESATLPRP